MLVWTPDPATSPWAEVQEDEVWTESAISVVDDEALLVVSGYSFEVIGEPLPGLVVTADAAGVVASAPLSLVGSFPAVDIEYQVNGVTGHCLSFAELPPDYTEVISYIASPANTKDWILRVTAHFVGGPSQSADFVLRVFANYNTGRDALKEAVNARRR